MDYAEKSGIETLAMALLEEMDKPKDDVWKNAPEWADVAEVCWRDKANTKHKQLLNPLTRELPKSRARQIAENPDCPFKSCQFWDDDADGKCGGELHGGSAQETCKWYADYESALKEIQEHETPCPNCPYHIPAGHTVCTKCGAIIGEIQQRDLPDFARFENRSNTTTDVDK